MRLIRLGYGRGVTSLCIPEERFGGLRGFEPVEEASRGDGRLTLALQELRSAGFLEATRGARLGLLVADGTRAWSPPHALPPLWPMLQQARAVDLFVCTGTHDPLAIANRELVQGLRAVLEGAPVPIELIVHDARRGPHRSVGVTRRGTPVAVDERLARCDALLILSDVKPHYFAGYSNPVKFVVPGLAAFETVRANHSLALDDASAAGRHPWHPDPERRTNPLADDLVEAFERVVGERPHFALTALREGPRLDMAWGGGTREAFERACTEVDRRSTLSVEPARFVVVSPGGWPHDESLYTAQRALELTSRAWRDGGEVLFLANCGAGIGPPGARENFFEPLCAVPDPAAPDPAAPNLAAPDPAAPRDVEAQRAAYRLYGHKPVRLARLLRRASTVWVKSELPKDEMRRAGFRSVEDPQLVIDDWLERAGPDDRILCFDHASRLVVV